MIDSTTHATLSRRYSTQILKCGLWVAPAKNDPLRSVFSSRNLAIADLLKTIGARHGVAAGVIAIVWTLRNSALTAAIVGGRSAKQVEGVIPAMDFQLSDAEYAEINAFLEAHP